MSASPKPRSVARLAAVQALYQMEVSAVGAEAVIREFSEHRFDRDADPDPERGEAPLAAADEAFFADLVRGVVEHQKDVDSAIAKRLASGWRLDRLDATARAILRAGAYELIHRSDVPTEVAIDEYVELAKSFFEGPEPGFVNGALDAVAQDARNPGNDRGK
jgi:N utilization substance protein B